VQVGTGLIHASSILQEKSAVFGPAERSMHQPPIVDILIERQQTDCSLFLLAVGNISAIT